MAPQYFVGLDLTDAYSTAQRPVDCAILDGTTGEIHFQTFEWSLAPRDPINAMVMTIMNATGGPTVFIVDGPQALATPKNGTRAVEAQLRTPAHTSWQLPEIGARPFAGYIRTSVKLFEALVNAGLVLAELDGEERQKWTLFEAYPGAVWPRLYNGNEPLQSKCQLVGRQQRYSILMNNGCILPNGPLNHDKLDAAVCAMLGWWFFCPRDGRSAQLFGGMAVNRDGAGNLREGKMLMPVVGGPNMLLPRGSVVVEAAPGGPARELPECNWVYFATTKGALQSETLELAVNEGIIARTLFNKHGRRIANTGNIKPGDKMLLAYGDGNPYKAMAILCLRKPANPAEGFPACCILDDKQLSRVLTDLNYPKDPMLNKHTAICVEFEQEVQDAPSFQRPGGNNAIWAWEDVFPKRDS